MTLYETGELIFEGRSSRVHRARRQPEGDLVLVKRLRDLYPPPTRSAGCAGSIGHK